jgi:dihydropteroate synthase
MSASTPHSRSAFDWRLRTRTLPLGHRSVIMGILNVTPDSFSDGGRFLSPETALDQALRMLDEGADLLDLGGESTRPTSTPITPDEEQSRVLPVLEAILHHRPDAILSIDTYHAATARRAIEAGAEIVNDVSGCLWDPTMATTIADLHCGAVLMHTRGRPEDWPTLPPLPPAEILPLVLTGLRHSLSLAHAAGIPTDRIVLDPGFGFGKLGTENYTLLAHLADLHQLGLPLLSGISRKGFLSRTIAALGQPTDHPTADLTQPIPPEARAIATQAANVASILAGAHILRVHDVRATRESAAIADAILHHT